MHQNLINEIVKGLIMTNKTALITGSTGGLGSQFVKLMPKAAEM
ncbi:hypothetical protein [Methanobrevibacter sp.]